MMQKNPLISLCFSHKTKCLLVCVIGFNPTVRCIFEDNRRTFFSQGKMYAWQHFRFSIELNSGRCFIWLWRKYWHGFFCWYLDRGMLVQSCQHWMDHHSPRVWPDILSFSLKQQKQQPHLFQFLQAGHVLPCLCDSL